MYRVSRLRRGFHFFAALLATGAFFVSGCVPMFEPEDFEGPTIVSINPQGDAVPLDAVVEIVFSEAIEFSEIEEYPASELPNRS